MQSEPRAYLNGWPDLSEVCVCVCVCECVCVNERTWAIWDTAGNISRGNVGTVEGHELELGHALDAVLSSWRWDPGRHFPPPRENNLAWHLAPNDGLTLERRKLKSWRRPGFPPLALRACHSTDTGRGRCTAAGKKKKIRKRGGFVPCFPLSPIGMNPEDRRNRDTHSTHSRERAPFS